jgi:DNA-binding PadR family transcriptional regulator
VSSAELFAAVRRNLLCSVAYIRFGWRHDRTEQGHQSMDRTRLGLTATLLLQALARGHGYGFDLMDATGLPSGTVYPLLRRLEARGLVRSRWEREAAAHGAGRPRRRNYELTAIGETALHAGLSEQRARLARFDELLDEAETQRRGSR